jgi:Tim44-like domain
VLTALGTSLGIGGALLAVLTARAAAASAAVTAVALLLLYAAGRVRWPVSRRRPAALAPDDALLAMARDRFVTLQRAWDRGDVDALRALTTEVMLDELLAQLPERGPGPNRTDVLSLEARLLAHDRLGALELASIEFSGIVRESPERSATPFREIWMLARDGGEQDWRLARQQALL